MRQVKTNELLFSVVNYKPDKYDKVLQLWRHGESQRLVLGVGDYLVTMTRKEQVELGELLLAKEKPVNNREPDREWEL